MMKITRRVFGAIAAVGTITAITAGVGTTLVQAQANRTINLYSARHYDTDKALYQGFTNKTGIRVNVIEAPADKLIERIRSEGANTPADVLMTVDAGNLWRAQEAGLLQPVRSNALQSAIPANLRDPGGHWFGLTRRARVIVYNKGRVKPSQLSTYEDLATPKWKNRVVMRSSSNVYNQSLVGSLLPVHGAAKTEAWAKGLVGNFARAPQGNDTSQIKDVAAGVGDVTLANTYYVVRLMESNKPEDRAIASKVGVFFPNQRDRGTHVNISGAGVVKNAKNRAAAVQFLEYLASSEAQSMLARGNNEYPARPGVPLDPKLAGLGRFKEDPMNAAEFGRNNAAALRLMDRAGWK